MVKKKKKRKATQQIGVSRVAKKYLSSNVVGNYCVKTVANCPQCRNMVSSLIADASDVPIRLFIENLHQIKGFGHIHCKNCDVKFVPKHIQVRNFDTDEVILTNPLNHLGIKPKDSLDGDVKEEYLKSILDNPDFLNSFINDCIKHFEKVVQDLSVKEITEALSVLQRENIFSNNIKSLRSYVLNNVSNEEDRRLFLQCSCEEFLLSFMTRNPMANWIDDLSLRQWGIQRTLIALVHVPLPKELERYRFHSFKYIQSRSKKVFEKFVCAYPYVASVLVVLEESEELSKKATKFEVENEELRVKVKDLESKNHLLRKELHIQKEKQHTEVLGTVGVMEKNKHLKAFIKELKEELNRLNELIEPANETEEALIEIDEKEIESFQDELIENVLQDKKVAIIGGMKSRKGQIEKDDVTILFHDGRKIDPQYYQVVQQADIIILITNYCSHSTMWETKSQAILEDKVIFYETHSNLVLLLNKVSEKYGEMLQLNEK